MKRVRGGNPPSKKKDCEKFPKRLFHKRFPEKISKRKIWDFFYCAKVLFPHSKEKVTKSQKLKNNIFRVQNAKSWKSSLYVLINREKKNPKISGKWMKFPLVFSKSLCEIIPSFNLSEWWRDMKNLFWESIILKKKNSWQFSLEKFCCIF